MTLSYTYSESTTFTATHARHIAAKVATDLKRVQRFYGEPSDAWISAYQEELTELLKGGLVGSVTYGFKRDGAWISPTLRYTARDLNGGTAGDDDPGRVQPGANTTNARFYSYLLYSSAWDSLPEHDRLEVKKRLPFQRNGAPEPAVNGYFHNDRTYSAGGRALGRASVRTF